MKNKSMKWIALIMAVSVMALSLVACNGGNTDADPSSDVSVPTESENLSSEAGDKETSSESPVGGADLSEEEYVAKIQEIYENITKASTDAMTGVDTEDIEALITATKNMIAAVQPYYAELRDLSAPEKYTAAQAKIKSGCEASLRSLEISLEMFDNMTDADKIAELQQEAADLESTVLELAEGLAEVGLTDLQ